MLLEQKRIRSSPQDGPSSKLNGKQAKISTTNITTNSTPSPCSSAPHLPPLLIPPLSKVTIRAQTPPQSLHFSPLSSSLSTPSTPASASPPASPSLRNSKYNAKVIITLPPKTRTFDIEDEEDDDDEMLGPQLGNASISPVEAEEVEGLYASSEMLDALIDELNRRSSTSSFSSTERNQSPITTTRPTQSKSSHNRRASIVTTSIPQAWTSPQSAAPGPVNRPIPLFLPLFSRRGSTMPQQGQGQLHLKPLVHAHAQAQAQSPSQSQQPQAETQMTTQVQSQILVQQDEKSKVEEGNGNVSVDSLGVSIRQQREKAKAERKAKAAAAAATSAGNDSKAPKTDNVTTPGISATTSATLNPPTSNAPPTLASPTFNPPVSLGRDSVTVNPKRLPVPKLTLSLEPSPTVFATNLNKINEDSAQVTQATSPITSVKTPITPASVRPTGSATTVGSIPAATLTGILPRTSPLPSPRIYAPLPADAAPKPPPGVLSIDEIIRKHSIALTSAVTAVKDKARSELGMIPGNSGAAVRTATTAAPKEGNAYANPNSNIHINHDGGGKKLSFDNVRRRESRSISISDEVSLLDDSGSEDSETPEFSQEAEISTNINSHKITVNDVTDDINSYLTELTQGTEPSMVLAIDKSLPATPLRQHSDLSLPTTDITRDGSVSGERTGARGVSRSPSISRVVSAASLVRRASKTPLTRRSSVSSPTQQLQVDLANQEALATAIYLRSPNLTRIVHLPRPYPKSPLRVSFADLGKPNGRPVVIYLGLGCVRYLIGLYDELAKALNLRLICIDRWGLGKTDQIPQEERGVLDWAEVVEKVLDHIGVNEFQILAHSAGAPYALATALRLKSRVKGKIHLLAPWVGSDVDGGYKWLKWVPNGIIKSAMAAEWRLESYLLGKAPTVRHKPVSSEDAHNNTIDRKEDVSSPTSCRTSLECGSVPSKGAGSRQLNSRASWTSSDSRSPPVRQYNPNQVNANDETRRSRRPSTSEDFYPTTNGTHGYTGSIGRSPRLNGIRSPGRSQSDDPVPSLPSLQNKMNNQYGSVGSRRPNSAMGGSLMKGGQDQYQQRPASLDANELDFGLAEGFETFATNLNLNLSVTYPGIGTRVSFNSTTPTNETGTTTYSSISTSSSFRPGTLTTSTSTTSDGKGGSFCTPSNSSLFLALSQASHAECLQGTTADLLTVVLGRDARPWGFSYADVKHPCKIWYGKQDERVSEKSMRWMEMVMNAKIIVLEQEGHNLMSSQYAMCEVLDSLANDDLSIKLIQ